MVVCGGDGTINEAVNGLAFSKTRLAILPGGTANIIAKELGLPRQLVRAARELPQWRPRLVPLGLATWPSDTGGGSGESGIAEKLGVAERLGVGTRDLGSFIPNSQPPTPDSRLLPHEVQHRYFLSVGGIGFDAHIIEKLKHDFKMFLGVAAYGIEALRQVTRYGFPPFICRADGRQVQAAFAAIQRTSRYAGWFRMAPRANFFEPRLDACLFQSRRWPRYLVYLAALTARRHLQLADVTMIETERLECFPVEPEARILFELDGELAGALPAAFEVTRDTLTLLTPGSRK